MLDAFINLYFFFFFFQAEDGIRDHCVTGVQTCALPISKADVWPWAGRFVVSKDRSSDYRSGVRLGCTEYRHATAGDKARRRFAISSRSEIGRASCRERV